MKTPILSVLATILLLTACGGSSPSQPLVSPAVKVNQPERTDGLTFKVDRAVTLQEDLSNLESFQSNLNIYVMTMTIPNSIAKDLRIKKNVNQIIDSSAYQYGEDSVTVTDLIDMSEVKLIEQNYEYEIENDGKSLQPVSFSIKPDLVIIGSRTLTDVKVTSLDIEVGALFLDANASLITDGTSISIKAETIISKDASIETFAAETVSEPAAKGKRGDSGGNLKITTNLLIGNINVFMRGKKGGAGIDGIAITEIPAQAASGQDSGSNDFCFDYEFRAPIFERALREIPPRCVGRACSTPATNGQPGAKGVRGNDGQPGAPGGDSGIFEIIAIKSSNQNKVNVNLLPGVGGDAGVPSAGGTGGAGGAGGASRNQHCQAGSPGPQGPQGDNGSPSVPGPSGAQQKPTITLNGKTE